MEGFETLKFGDSSWRDEIFRRLRHEPDHTPQERQAIKYSDVEAEMVSEEEFKLNAKGRVVYINYYFVAYPKEINGRRTRRRAEQERERAE